MPLLLFFLEIIAVSVFFTWVYINSSNSLWAVLLAHTGMNTAGYLISDVYKLDSSLSFNALFFIALLLTAIFIAVKTSQKKIEPARL
jgi:membrane protease YdiL (CAAX protease family)